MLAAITGSQKDYNDLIVAGAKEISTLDQQIADVSSKIEAFRRGGAEGLELAANGEDYAALLDELEALDA